MLEDGGIKSDVEKLVAETLEEEVKAEIRSVFVEVKSESIGNRGEIKRGPIEELSRSTADEIFPACQSALIEQSVENLSEMAMKSVGDGVYLDHEKLIKTCMGKSSKNQDGVLESVAQKQLEAKMHDFTQEIEKWVVARVQSRLGSMNLEGKVQQKFTFTKKSKMEKEHQALIERLKDNITRKAKEESKSAIDVAKYNIRNEKRWKAVKELGRYLPSVSTAMKLGGGVALAVAGDFGYQSYQNRTREANFSRSRSVDFLTGMESKKARSAFPEMADGEMFSGLKDIKSSEERRLSSFDHIKKMRIYKKEAKPNLDIYEKIKYVVHFCVSPGVVLPLGTSTK